MAPIAVRWVAGAGPEKSSCCTGSDRCHSRQHPSAQQIPTPCVQGRYAEVNPGLRLKVRKGVTPAEVLPH